MGLWPFLLGFGVRIWRKTPTQKLDAKVQGVIQLKHLVLSGFSLGGCMLELCEVSENKIYEHSPPWICLQYTRIMEVSRFGLSAGCFTELQAYFQANFGTSPL